MSWRSFCVETFWGPVSSWTWMSKSPPRFGKFSVIISLNKLSGSFSLSSPFRTPVLPTLLSWWYPIIYIGFLHSSSFFLLLLLFFSDWIISNDLFSTSQILSSAWSNMLLMFFIAFFLTYSLHSSAPEFSLVLFHDSHLTVNFILFLYYFSETHWAFLK